MTEQRHGVIDNRIRIWMAIGITIGVILVIYAIFANTIGRTEPGVPLSPARVTLLDSNVEHTAGYIFTIHWLLTGHVINQGGSNSGVVQLSLTVTSDQTGGVVYTTTFSPVPAILSPNQEATFSQPFSSDDMGGYTGAFHYSVQVTGQ